MKSAGGVEGAEGKMDLILSRHGNTFAPGQEAVWTGASNDLPLVEKGWQQADKLAHALMARTISLAAVYCGPLKRTRDYAVRVIEKVKFPGSEVVDPRLNEIDYGDW